MRERSGRRRVRYSCAQAACSSSSICAVNDAPPTMPNAKCSGAVDRACSSRIGRGVMAWMTVPSRPQGWWQCSRSHEDAAAFVLTYNRTLGWNLCGKGGYPIVLAELSGAGRRNFGGTMVSTTKIGDAVRHDMSRATPYAVHSASSHRPDATRISSAVRAKNSDRRRVGGVLGSAPLATEFSVRRVSGAIGTRRTNLNQRVERSLVSIASRVHVRRVIKAPRFSSS